MSLFGGGSAQGTVRYALLLDDTDAVTKLNNFRTSLIGLAQPTNSVVQNIGTLNTNFQGIGAQLKSTDTGFASLKTSISGMSAPTQTVATNMGALNNNFKLLATTEQGLVSNTNTLKTDITGLVTPTQNVNTGIQSLVGNMGPLASNFQTVDGATKTVTTDIKGLVGNMGPLASNFELTSGAAKDMISKENQLSSSNKSLGSSIKDGATKFAGFATGIATTVTGVIGLVRSIRDLENKQIAVDKATRRVSLAQEAYDKVTQKLKDDTIKYGASSKEVKQDLLDQTQQSQKLSIETRVLTDKTNEQNDALQNVATSGFVTLLGATTTSISGFRDLGLSVISTKEKFGIMATAAGGARVALASLGLTAAAVAVPVLAIASLIKDIPELMAFDKAKITSLDPLKPMLERFKAEKVQLEQILQPLNWDPASWAAVLNQIWNPQEIENAKKRLAFLEVQIAKLEKTTGGATLTEKGYNDQMNMLNGTLPTIANSADGVSKSFNQQASSMLLGHQAANDYSAILVDLNQNLSDGQTMSGLLAKATENVTAHDKAGTDALNARNVVMTVNQALLTEQHDGLVKQAIALGVSGNELAGLTDVTNKNNQEITVQNSKLTGIINKYGELTPAQKAANDKWKEQNAVMLQVGAGLADISNTLGIQLNPNLIKTTKQLEDAKKAATDFDNAINDLRDPKALFGLKPFKLKFEVEKEFQDFFNDLPKGLRKDITLSVKSESATENSKRLLELVSKTQLQTIALGIDFRPNEKGADKFIDETIDQLKEQFKQKGQDLTPSPEVQLAIDKLLEIKNAPDSWSKVTEYFQSPEFLATIDKIDPQTQHILDALLPLEGIAQATQQIAEKIGGGISSSLSKFLQSGKSRFSGTDAGNKILQSLTITIPAPDTTAFDAGIKTAKESVTGSAGLVKAINTASSTLPRPNIDAIIKGVGDSRKSIATVQTFISKMKMSFQYPNIDKIIKAVGDARKSIATVGDAVRKLDGQTATVHIKVQSDKVPSGIRTAQHGMHETLGNDTLILAHANERVDIGMGTGTGMGMGSGGLGVSNGKSNGDIIMINATFRIEGNDIINSRELKRQFKMDMGTKRWKHG